MSEKNAWLSIWAHPRETIRRIVAENKDKSLWLLASIYGFSSLLSSFQSLSLGSIFGVLPIFLLALIFAPIWGYVAFSIWSWVVTWSGKWLKGSGDFRGVRAAYAWSCVPLVVSDLIWLAMLVLFGVSLFMSPAAGGQVFPQGQMALLLVLLLAKVVLSVWSLVIYINTLAEVQKFSALRAIGNIVIAGILIGVVVGILSILSMYIVGVP